MTMEGTLVRVQGDYGFIEVAGGRQHYIRPLPQGARQGDRVRFDSAPGNPNPLARNVRILQRGVQGGQQPQRQSEISIEVNPQDPDLREVTLPGSPDPVVRLRLP